MSQIGENDKFFNNLHLPAVRILFCGYVQDYSPGRWHHHMMCPFWRFYWGASDGAALYFSDRRLQLDPQHVVCVPPEVLVRTEAEKPFHQLFIHFEWDGAPSFSEPLIFSAMDEWDFLHGCPVWSGGPAESAAIHMYHLLFCYLPKIREQRPTRERKIDLRIRRAVRLLDDWRDDRPLAEIAREVSMSRYHFMELFKEQIGIPPGQYRMMCRMNYARELMYDPELSIGEIAEKTRFRNRFHFSKAFKRFFKLPPGAYRRTLTGDPPPEGMKYGFSGHPHDPE